MPIGNAPVVLHDRTKVITRPADTPVVVLGVDGEGAAIWDKEVRAVMVAMHRHYSYKPLRVALAFLHSLESYVRIESYVRSGTKNCMQQW